MKINLGYFVLAIAAVTASVAHGRNGVEFKSKDKATHYFDNSGEWQCSGVSGAVLPVNGDTVRMAGLGNDCTVYLRNNTTLAARVIEFKGGYTSAQSRKYGFLRFAGDGYTFLMPSIAAGDVNADGNSYTYASSPFKFGCCVSSTDRWFMYNDELSSTSIAPLKMTNPDFTCGITSDGVNYMTFSKGTFNFCDPEGESNGSRLYIGALQTIASTMNVSRDATFRMYKGQLSMDTATVGVMTLNQAGAFDVATSFAQKSGTWNIDGGTVTAQSLSISKGTLTATNSASLTFSDSVTVEGSSSAPRLYLGGGSFTAGGTVCLAHNSSSYDGLISVSGGSFSSSSADGLQVGTSGGNGTFEISGGSAAFKRIRLARGSGSGNTLLRQTGGDLDISSLPYGYVMFLQNSAGRAGTHTIELNGGVTALRYIENNQPSNSAATCQLWANGGTLRACTHRDSSSSPFIKGLKNMKLGPKGLTFDTAGFGIYVEQDMTNQGSSGLLKKVGSGTLTYVGSNDVANTVVAGGTLLVSGTNSTLSTALTVASGATFSLVGTATRATLSSLTATNATIALDPGDVIAVNGPISVHMLKLNWSRVPTSSTPFLSVNGRLDEDTKASIRAARFVNELPEGTHAAYTFGYNTVMDYTTISAKVATDEPLTDSVTWTGSGAWATPANWSGNATPEKTQVASFTSASAGKTVVVADGDKAGSLAFGADGYTLTGTGPLKIVGESGAAQIAATAGSNTIDVPVQLSFRTTVPVEAGATLSIAKAVSGDSLVKTGTGKLTLGAENALDYGISSAGGILEVTNPGALGPSGDYLVALKGGTVQFAGSGGAPMNFPASISVLATNTSEMVVFKADTDTALDMLHVTKGAFCKRGTGKLTVYVPEATVYTLAAPGSGTATGDNTAWFPSGSEGIVFPDNGMAPDSAGGRYPGFSIAEGEMALVGTGEGAAVSMMNARVLIGLYAKTCAVQPMLTVDSVYLDCRGSHWFLGHSVGANGIAVTNPVLRILNGGTVHISSSQIGYNSTSSRSSVTLAATNGTFLVAGSGSDHYLTRMNGSVGGARAFYRFKDSSHYLDNTAKIGGGIDLDFDNSVFSSSSGGPVTLTAESDRPWGTMLFRNGSMFAYGGFTESSSMNKTLTFAFDDAELKLNADRAYATLKASTTGFVHYEMRGKGAVLKPAGDATYMINATLEGAGGLVLAGEGTVALASGKYAFTGTCDVRSGTLELSSAGTISNPRFAATTGGGAISGGTISGMTLSVPLSDEWLNTNGIPTFADCAISGRVIVDAGRTDANALTFPENSGFQPVAVAHLTGTTTADVTTWKLKNTGNHEVSGRFSLVDGTVYLTPAQPFGGTIILR